MTARILPFTRTTDATSDTTGSHDGPDGAADARTETSTHRRPQPPRRRPNTAGASTTAVCVDGWGRDSAFVGRVVSLSKLRWDVTLGGVEHLPPRAGALIVINARRFSLAPVYTALAVGEAIGRPVRFVGRPDTAPAGPLLRRLGGLLAEPAEIRTALRARQIVVLGTEPALHPRRVGRADHRMVGAAVQERVRVFPAATASSPINRHARVEVGPDATTGRRRRGPLGELELADVVQARIRNLLDELGGFKSGTPLDWIPLSSMGGGQ